MGVGVVGVGLQEWVYRIGLWEWDYRSRFMGIGMGVVR